ncbi:hypothetical protein N825_18995 [Skermanella stibiiresistens SB22]|uniref:DUF488 domain-containing protein n=1 Tax=Skermanella stibiiresistens SB22 TaxID=1385369 RepID=W9H714_9PROT|nr:DUF488 domain-containing protein [Skermanella stibiiresistens]EWY42025.1 hypothetical protein N825_18995 [Skermanella stibiiresistens SB22]
MAAAPTIWTIGYERASSDALLSSLKQAGVKVLMDVRDLPLSRRAGFSKSTLRASLEATGIEYLHLKGLGTPKEGRIAAKRRDYDLFWQIVDERMATPEAEFDLLRAAEVARERPSALLCFEADPAVCHRQRVADALADRFGFRIEHIHPTAVV